MPEQRHIVVSYRRQVSDGNYGTEAIEVGLDWWLDQDNNSETDLDFATALVDSARGIVLDGLRESLSRNVRAAVAAPHPTTPTRVVPATPVGDEELPF